LAWVCKCILKATISENQNVTARAQRATTAMCCTAS